jgi:predicted metalloendopeptidase
MRWTALAVPEPALRAGKLRLLRQDLNGQKEIAALEARAGHHQPDVGEALGQLYVKAPSRPKPRPRWQLVKNLRTALKARIEKLTG